MVTNSGTASVPTVLVVDMANVVGSVPDGWWRDRVRAAETLLSGLLGLLGRDVEDPGARPTSLVRIVAVLEGRANRARVPEQAGQPLVIVRAEGSGDDAIAQVSVDLIAAGDQVCVVTADRGLRPRLPAAASTAGPVWLNGLLGRSNPD